MVEQIVPVLKVADTARAAEWYTRLGFVKEFEERYSEEFPGYVGIARNGQALHLSERVGDATPDTLVYLVVDDVEAVAAEASEAGEQTAVSDGGEFELTDPDGNRIRIGSGPKATVSAAISSAGDADDES